MKDIKELRDALADVFTKLQNDKIEQEKAASLTNCAGKIIGTLRVEIEYAALHEEKPDIKFLEGETKR